MVNNITTKEDFDSAIQANKLVVVDFFATWCGPCKTIAPELVKLSKTYENADFLKVDVDELAQVAEKAEVTAMPTFVLYKNGKSIETVVGANPKALEAAIEKHYK